VRRLAQGEDLGPGQASIYVTTATTIVSAHYRDPAELRAAFADPPSAFCQVMLAVVR
jgi:hypothetical protein